MSLIKKWTDHNKKQGLTQEKAVEALNLCCGGKLRTNEISAMKKGTRDVSACVNRLMLAKTLDSTLREFGYRRKNPLSAEKFAELVDALTPPERIK